MSLEDFAVLALVVKPLGGVLPDRLQHPEALVGEAEEALLDERLQRVEIGSCDLLRRVQRAAAREDRERSEETLLFLRQEVVAPSDRRPERLLSRLGVPAAFQQVESLGEALQDLCGRECLRAGGGKLYREREIVEPRAELGDLVPSHRAASARRRARPPPRRRAVGLRTRLRPARAGARGSSPTAPGSDRTRTSPESSGAASITCSRLSRRRSISRSPMCSASPSSCTRASARSSPTRARARGGRRARPRRHPP